MQLQIPVYVTLGNHDQENVISWTETDPAGIVKDAIVLQNELSQCGSSLIISLQLCILRIGILARQAVDSKFIEPVADIFAGYNDCIREEDDNFEYHRFSFGFSELDCLNDLYSPGPFRSYINPAFDKDDDAVQKYDGYNAYVASEPGFRIPARDPAGGILLELAVRDGVPAGFNHGGQSGISAVINYISEYWIRRPGETPVPITVDLILDADFIPTHEITVLYP